MLSSSSEEIQMEGEPEHLGPGNFLCWQKGALTSDQIEHN